MRSFPALAGIEALNVIVDNDESGAGLEAARECEARWLAAGAEVNLHMSDEVGDLDDAFRRAEEPKLENDPNATPKNEGSP